MENSKNIYAGEYGVRESLLALKQEEEAVLQEKKKELVAQIADQLAECEKLSAERDASKEEIEREYSIRINSANRDLDRYRNQKAEIEKKNEELKKELAGLSFVAVGKKKQVSESIADCEKQLENIAKNIRVNETSLKELNEAKDRKIEKLSGALNKANEAIKDVTDVIDTYNAQIEQLQSKQAEYNSLDDYDLHKLLNTDEVLKEYVFALIKRSNKSLNFVELQHKNVVFALIPDERVNNVIKTLVGEKAVTETVEGDAIYFAVVE